MDSWNCDFSDLAIKGDTVIINYNFFDNNGQLILPSMMKTYKQLITGVGFDIINKAKIYMESSGGFSVVTRVGEDNRYENPLQPKVLKYITDNCDKLDDCFRKLAEQKGIKRLTTKSLNRGGFSSQQRFPPEPECWQRPGPYRPGTGPKNQHKRKYRNIIALN